MEIVDKKIKDYLDLVCSYIRNKDVHNEVSEELKEHIYEIYYEGIDSGLSKEVSITKAIERMGDTYTLGHKLNKVHKAKPDYISLILIVALIGVGIASMLLMQKQGLGSKYMILNSGIALAVGLVAGIFLYYYDYRRIEKYSIHIYIITILGIILSWQSSTMINGMPDKVASLSNLIVISFLISLSGLISKKDLSKFKNVALIFFLGFLSIIIIVAIPNKQLALFYIGTLTVIFLISSAKKVYKVMLILIELVWVVMFFTFYVASRPYILYILQYMINPLNAEYKDVNYIYIESNKLLQSAGLLGKDISVSGINLPNIHTDFAFLSMVYSLGWIVATIVLIAIGLFIVRNLFLAKKIKNDFGRYIVVSIIIFMFMQFITSVLVSLGLLGVNSTMPFISYGGANLASNIIIIGLLMSVYRRKNLKSFISVNL